MTAVLEHILTATDARQTGPDRYEGHCRAHGSQKHRDLGIRISGNRILLHCRAACPKAEVVQSLGVELKDLFLDTPRTRGYRPAPKPPRLNRAALAFDFTLAALDRRLRSDTILSAAGQLDVSTLTDEHLDRLMDLTALAYEDRERAAVLEHVADGLMERHHAKGLMK